MRSRIVELPGEESQPVGRQFRGPGFEYDDDLSNVCGHKMPFVDGYGRSKIMQTSCRPGMKLER
jgi:hypothetical protein